MEKGKQSREDEPTIIDRFNTIWDMFLPDSNGATSGRLTRMREDIFNAEVNIDWETEQDQNSNITKKIIKIMISGELSVEVSANADELVVGESGLANLEELLRPGQLFA